MKAAIVVEAFPGVEDGKVHPREIAVDERITGDLAEAAIRAGWAVETEAAGTGKRKSKKSGGK